MNRYATLAQARTEIKETGVDASQDAVIEQALYFVSNRIELLTGYKFAPYIATYNYDSIGDGIDDFYNTIDMKYPLLDPTNVQYNAIPPSTNDVVLVEGTDYVTRPLNETPFWQLRRLNLISWSQGYFYGSPFLGIYGFVDRIGVTGIWGYRTNYPDEAYLLAVDSVQDVLGISSSTTSVTVADADGSNVYGYVPRFSPGNIIRIDDEWMEVIATNTTTNVLTVRRGINGSTAASHTLGTAIDVWVPEPDITRAALRWVGYIYKRRGFYEALKIEGAANVVFPEDAPAEVLNILARYQWTRTVGAV